MNNTNEVNKMGTVPVKRLLLTLGVPMIISMVLQAFYNIVDSAFVSNMSQNGEAALNALTLAFPVQMLIVALSIGTGVGANAVLSRSLGQRDMKKVGLTAGNALFLAAVIYVLCLLFGCFGVRVYISSQTSNPVILEMAVDYLRICCVAAVGIVFFSIFEKLLQAIGLSLYSTIAQVAGAVINIVLDPILIYGLLGLPEMGVRGAAYATVIGQIASFLLAMGFHFKFNKEVENKLRNLKPSLKIIKEIYAVGVPAIIAQALMSVMTYGLNVILVRVDETMVTAYGLYYKIQQFILFAAFGLRDAITPIVAFNYGMGDKKRVNDGIKYGVLYTLIVVAVGLIGLELFAEPLAKVFDVSGVTLELCISAIRIISISFICAGLNIALQGVFQAMDSGLQSLIISVCRQFLFVLPVAWGFAEFVISSGGSEWLVWLTFPIAETLSAIIGAIFMRNIYKTKIKSMDSFGLDISE